MSCLGERRAQCREKNSAGMSLFVVLPSEKTFAHRLAIVDPFVTVKNREVESSADFEVLQLKDWEVEGSADFEVF
jgi:hypothetical protein